MASSGDRYHEILYEVARAINSKHSLDSVLEAVCEQSARAAEAKACSIILLSPNREHLLHEAAYGLSDSYVRKGPMGADQSLSDVVEGKVVQVLDATNDPRVQYREQAAKEGIASILCVPLVLRGEVIGVVRVYTGEPRDFSRDEVDFLQAVANLGAIAIDNERLYEHPRRSHGVRGTRPEEMIPHNTVFVILSFEGPDPYSMAGGLGVRVTHLSETLASMGFPVHLFFVGDHRRPGEERRHGGKLTFHRWCQWISQYHPDGVYQGEEGKLNDFNESLPSCAVDRVIRPAVSEGKIVAILGEEWHTAEAMCRISDLMHDSHLRNRAVLFWNANNTMGFERVNWGRLSFTTTITTVSRYMRQIMKGMGLNPLVIPNGIPQLLLHTVSETSASKLRSYLGADLVLCKVARWDPAKGWMECVEAVARLKARGPRTTLLARGGIEPYGGEVLARARSLGLSVHHARAEGESTEDFFRAIKLAAGADVVNLLFPIPQSFLRIMYRASDAVLANSLHEPFGLVGLEAMAAAAVPVLGGTGEDYAIPFRNCFITETGDPEDIAAHVMYLHDHPEKRAQMRRSARRMARAFTWEAVARQLVSRLENQARAQGVLTAHGGPPTPTQELGDETEREAAHLPGADDGAVRTQRRAGLGDSMPAAIFGDGLAVLAHGR
ncbi:MAG: GAF domain-containing protein [Chloroflexi bacterium]|nr:GAF domain-containing protein [Chloroflexota bacterium]